MNLVSTRQEYRLEDASGYSFHVVADLDPEFGWSATVSAQATGHKTPEAALTRLTETVEHLLRQLKEQNHG